MSRSSKPRRTTAALDRLRAEALKGNPLDELSDADREWIWRSLLKGVRRREVVQLTGFSPEQVTRGLHRVRTWYKQRCQDYKREQALAAQQPKVVRPVVVTPKPLQPIKRRGLWLFGKRQ